MNTRKTTLYVLIAALTTIGAATSALGQTALDRERARAFDQRVLQGTYVHSGPVLINPPVINEVGVQERQLIRCFSTGTMTFDGAGAVTRRVEIFCPYTDALALLGVPAPPLGQPTPEELAFLGSAFESAGTYTVDADGWGQLEDVGTFRFGAVSGLPMASVLQFSLGRLGVRGVARELNLLVKNQSTQFPGAPMLINSDVGAAFVAVKR